MAYQIIQHRIVKPVEYAVHFECGCGCEFWADKSSFKEYCIRDVGIIDASIVGNPYYKARCPECNNSICSMEPPVPKSDVFTE